MTEIIIGMLAGGAFGGWLAGLWMIARLQKQINNELNAVWEIQRHELSQASKNRQRVLELMHGHGARLERIEKCLRARGDDA